jgi:hypothetical protein
VRSISATSRSASTLFDNLPEAALPAGWVGVDPIQVKRAAWGLRMLYAIPPLVIIAWLLAETMLLRVDAAPEFRRAHLLVRIVLGAAFLATVLGALWISAAARRGLQSRIGADSTHLLWDPGTGEIERHEWSSVLTDKSSLLIGRTLLPLTRPGLPPSSIYSHDPLRGVILARLPLTSYVTRLQLVWHALKRGNVALWIMVGNAALCLAVSLVLAVEPEWLRASGAALRQWITQP